MNLIQQPWLLLEADGTEPHRATPSGIADPAAIDLIAPRADFRGALYQFLIGLLQTAFAPADHDEWLERWHTPPTPEQLAAVFAPWASAFELDAAGPAFMQDWDLPQGEIKPIAGLLIDAPGGKTEKDNLDFFVKGGAVTTMCPCCAATALFTLQINAPSGGQGHRVSLRGGGPLTTLVLPRDPRATLWHKLWLNVLPAPSGATAISGRVLPWLAATHLSDKGQEVQPGHVDLLQAYWSMPRRIRLDGATRVAGTCDVCGAHSEQLYTQFRTKNFGNNYAGPWRHPLSPYTLDPKNEKPPISLKGQKGGIGYRHWVGLVIGDERIHQYAAAVVRDFNAHKYTTLPRRQPARLWCFGYDMDNMKARCWYDATLPIHNNTSADFRHAVEHLLDTAKEAAQLLGKYVREARGDDGTDPAVVTSFWQTTESLFYQRLEAMAAETPLTDATRVRELRGWLQQLREHTLSLFDHWILVSPIDQKNLRRVIAAREGDNTARPPSPGLRKGLEAAKPMKLLRNSIQQEAQA